MACLSQFCAVLISLKKWHFADYYFFYFNMYKAFGLQNTNVIYNVLYLQYFKKCGYIGCPKKRYRRPTIPSETQANPDPEIETIHTGPKQTEAHQP